MKEVIIKSVDEKDHHIIYKITNILNGKIYIGVHSTDDLNDNYLGSGCQLKKDKRLFGKENFKKEILFDFKSRYEAIQKEKELVDKSFIKEQTNYNCNIGGNPSRGSEGGKGFFVNGLNMRKYFEFRKANENIFFHVRIIKQPWDRGFKINAIKEMLNSSDPVKTYNEWMDLMIAAREGWIKNVEAMNWEINNKYTHTYGMRSFNALMNIEGLSDCFEIIRQPWIQEIKQTSTV